jgi:transcriptional regulator with XRE-family HTH domain
MTNEPSYARWALEPYSIGMKLRTLRMQKRLTLSRLAIETGLSTALLSKLETDRMVPTLPTLASICRVYGVGLSHFFSEPTRHTLSITRKAHLSGDGRSHDSVKHTPLHAPIADCRLQAEMIEFPQGGSSSVLEGGRSLSKLVYVLEGRLELEAGGIHEVLECGDCAYLESEMTIAWNATGTSRCRALVVAPAVN